MSVVEDSSEVGNCDISKKDDSPHANVVQEGFCSEKPLMQPNEPKKCPPRSERKRILRQKKLAEQKLRRAEKKADKKLRHNNHLSDDQVVHQGETAEHDNEDQASFPDPSQLQDNEDPEHVPKKRRIEQIKERLKQAMCDGQKIAIDCSLEQFMSEKESSKLAQQLCRLYGQNRKSDQPVHLYFTGLNKSGHLYSECVRKNSGFENYLVDMTEQHHSDIFPKESIVCLSPDSSNVLTSVEKEKVYVIGGLVDEHVQKGKSASSAEAFEIATARLPLDEYMEKTDEGTFKKVLTVNQVFGILLTFAETGDWNTSLKEWVPSRHGFKLKSDIS